MMGQATFADLLADSVGARDKLKALKTAVTRAPAPERAAFEAAGHPYLAVFEEPLTDTYLQAMALKSAIEIIQPQANRPKGADLAAALAVLRGSGPDGQSPAAQWKDAASSKAGLTAVPSPWSLIGAAAASIAGQLQPWNGPLDVTLALSGYSKTAWNTMLQNMRHKKTLPYFVAAFIAEHGVTPNVTKATRMSGA
jgi:hypothetical protein